MERAPHEAAEKSRMKLLGLDVYIMLKPLKTFIPRVVVAAFHIRVHGTTKPDYQ